MSVVSNYETLLSTVHAFIIRRGSVGVMKVQFGRDLSRLEDYLETIYHLVQDKGYASTVEIAERLQVSPSSVSSMLKNLANGGYLDYEPYRGMKLTERGRRSLYR